MSRFVCVQAGVCKMLKAKQKRVKLVDASGMSVRVHADKAVSAEEEQERRGHMESVRQSTKRTTFLQKPWNGPAFQGR